MVVMVCKPLLLIANCKRLKTYTSFHFAGTRRVIDKTKKTNYKLRKIDIEIERKIGGEEREKEGNSFFWFRNKYRMS